MPTAHRALRLPVPVHLIGGALSSGKTSIILHLLSLKPQNEVWAVLVNELGAVGIDEAVLTAAGGAVQVRRLAGGCLCCTMTSVTAATLVQLVRSAKPDRLLIEPSGLAHPAALLSLLRGPNLASALAVQPVTCLLDLTQFGDGGTHGGVGPEDSPYWAQLSVADIVVGTKADACTEAALGAFHKWAAAALLPPKRVLTCAHSQVSLDALGLASGARPVELGQGSHLESAARFPATRPSKAQLDAFEGVGLQPAAAGGEGGTPRPGYPVRGERQDAASGVATCGWVFHRDEVFDRQRVLDFMAAAAPHVRRIKGVVRVSDREWVAVSAGRLGSTPVVSCQETKHKADSRLEIIAGLETRNASGAIGEVGSWDSSWGELATALRRQSWSTVQLMLLGLR